IDAEMTLHDVAIMRFSRWWRRLVRSGFAFADVWWLHRHSRYGIYLRETGRAVFWGGFLPLVIAVGAFMNLNTLWLALIYPLHICWIALRRGPSARQSWTYGLFMVLGKFAEFNGVL